MKRAFCVILAGFFLLTGCGNRVDFTRHARVNKSPGCNDYAIDDYGFLWRVDGFSDGDEIELLVHEGGILGEFDDDTVVEIRIIRRSNAEVFDLEARVIYSHDWYVKAIDASGDVWAFYADGLSVGDNVTMVISNGKVIDLR